MHADSLPATRDHDLAAAAGLLVALLACAPLWLALVLGMLR